MTLALDRPRHRTDLVRELVVRDIKLRYRRSVLGIAWSQLAPLSMIAVLSLVFAHAVHLGIPNYSAFLFASLLPWIWFQNSLVAGTSSVVGGRDLIRQPGFHSPLLPVVAIGTSLVNYVLALPVMFVWIGVTTGRVSATALALPVIILIQFLITLGPTFILAALNVTFRDIAHIVEILLLPLFYATPIVYAQPTHTLRLLYDLNPLAHLLSAYRAVLVEGRWPAAKSLALLFVIGVAMTIVGFWVFDRLSDRFASEL